MTIFKTTTLTTTIADVHTIQHCNIFHLHYPAHRARELSGLRGDPLSDALRAAAAAETLIGTVIFE